MKKIRWMAETAIMLALLIVLQWVTKPLGQIVTGSCVNAVLAISTLVTGLSAGLTVAILSPLFAFLLGIAPQLVTVPAIMAGNAVFVAVLSLGKAPQLWKRIGSWLAAALAKFLALQLTVVWLICGLAAPALLEAGLLKAPMLDLLPTMFSLPQLITALLGGGVAMLIFPTLHKAIHK